jgi:uncharacterized membrane protein YkvA (DUF1232 family)
VFRLLRALPALGAMIAGLMRDPSLPRTVKVALVAAAVYLASPIDLVPDLFPLLGWVDDVLIAAIVLDGLLNFVDRHFLLRYWPGSERSLNTLARIARTLTAWVPASVKARIFSTTGR